MTPTQTPTLADFLLARIAEDEAVARLLGDRKWFICDDGHIEEPLRDDDPWNGTGEYQQWADGELRLPNHHNNWYPALDPARVLAECEAKRRIVELYVDAVDEAETDDEYGVVKLLETVVRDLASIYADHPDHQAEWKP